jgi:DNA-binding CsgD family transcriptional regulator/tetratricopeptide (TPR) repeat protein
MIGGVAQRVSSPVFVGRVSEIDQLRAALGRAAVGTPATVVVAGEAGVGKTRLVAELVGQAPEFGAIALVGGCLDVGDGVLAYTPVVEALRSLVGAVDAAELDRVLGSSPTGLARLVPELGAGVPDADVVTPARLFESLLGVLHRLAERRPVLLVAEDLHWADQSTRDLLGFLVRNLRRGVCLVLTYRSDDLHRRHPLRPFLAELERGGRAERLPLGVLDRRGVTGLLAGILGGQPPAGDVADVLARSGGNPFFAEELLAARHDGTVLPTALRDVVLARVEVLSEAAQRVLRVAAVAGRRVDHQLLAVVAAQPVGELVDVLREAVAHHVLTPEEGSESYAFRHALVQEIIYDELLPVERAPLHAAYARALSTRTQARPDGAHAVELGQLAYHWYAAHDLGAALAACVRAGQAAEATYALAEAQQQYERALELWDQVPDAATRSPLDRVTLLQRAAQAAFPTGDHDRAIALIDVALRTTDAEREPLRTGVLLERLARFHWVAGESARAMAAIERAVAAIPAEPPTPERARALAAHGQMLMLVGRHGAAVERCEDAVRVAREVGARGEEGHALTTLASSLAMLGHIDRASGVFERAGQIAEEVGHADDLCRVRINHATALALYGRWADAARLNLDCYRLAQRFGAVRTYGMSALTDAAESLIFLGRLAEAAPMLEEVFELDLPAGLAAPCLQSRALYHLYRGELAAAQADLVTVLDSTQLPLDPQYASPQFARLAIVALWDARLTDARAAVADGLAMVADTDDGSLVLELCLAGLTVEAATAEQALARRATDELTEARRNATRLIERARDVAGSLRHNPLGQARLATAEAEHTRARGSTAADCWAAAATAWQNLGCPYETGYAGWQHGEALLRAGAARDDVAAVLVQGWTAANDLGARLLTDEITALARRARIDITAAAPETAEQPIDPGEKLGLTPREREVLTHVAAGRTNRQIAAALFISDKTASVHVSNILAKLHATNRGEAAAIAHRLGLSPVD